MNVPTEHSEAVGLADYMRHRGVVFCHVPNGGRRGQLEALRLRAEGVMPGVPDYLVFSGPGGRKLKSLHGIAVELKRRKGGRVTRQQEEWLEILPVLGWHAFVAHGADDAIKQLEACWK